MQGNTFGRVFRITAAGESYGPALQIVVDGLQAGDVVRVVTGEGSEVLFQAPAPGIFKGGYRMAAAGFARVEVLRAFLPGVPMLPALISNPIYFNGEK